MTGVHVPYVDAAGVLVHYLEHGPRDAERTLVLLHGFTPDHRFRCSSRITKPGTCRRIG